jgi:hypothetical protein
MLNPPTPDVSARPTESWAEVRARGHVVRYRRSGTGRTVVAFGLPERTDTAWPELLDALGAGFRLLVPEPPPSDDDIPCWLSSFLEGLGMPSVRILAAGRLCAPVLQLALVDGEQIAGVVLIADGEKPVDAVVRELTVPVLVIDRSLPADELVPLVSEVFRGG